MKSNAQLLADLYASQGGREQLLVAVYEDGAAVYANVAQETALRIGGRLATPRPLVLEETARSADGMTFCWTVRRSKEHPGAGDWRDLLMTHVRAALLNACPQLLPADGTVMYVDNRQRDLDTLESFCNWFRRQKPAA